MKIALVGLLGLSMLKGCDFGDPQAVRQQTEESLRPFFPNVKAVVEPQLSAIVGFTCTDGIGPQLVEELGRNLPSNPGLQRLKQLRTYGGITGSHTYKYFAIGFQQGWVVYDMDTGMTSLQWQGNQQWQQAYNAACGQSAGGVPQAVSAAATRQVYVYVGHFTVKVSDAHGAVTTFPTVDSLGIWNDEAMFEANKENELQARENLIRAALAPRGQNLLHLALDSVEKVPINVQ